jgi:hypothetical protein
VITGSIKAHRSSDKSLGYGLRSLTLPSQHSQARQPAITLQIYSITVRHHGHQLAYRPLRYGTPFVETEISLKMVANEMEMLVSSPATAGRCLNVHLHTVMVCGDTDSDFAEEFAVA